MEPTRCTLLLSIFISTSLHVSGNYVPIIRRTFCIYANTGIFHSVWVAVWSADQTATQTITVVVISYRRFGTTYRSHLQTSSVLDLEDGTDRLSRNYHWFYALATEHSRCVKPVIRFLRSSVLSEYIYIYIQRMPKKTYTHCNKGKQLF